MDKDIFYDSKIGWYMCDGGGGGGGGDGEGEGLGDAVASGISQGEANAAVATDAPSAESSMGTPGIGMGEAGALGGGAVSEGLATAAGQYGGEGGVTIPGIKPGIDEGEKPISQNEADGGAKEENYRLTRSEKRRRKSILGSDEWSLYAPGKKKALLGS